MPDNDPFPTVAKELHGFVFGPGTDLHASSTVEDVEAALRFCHGGGVGQSPAGLLDIYGVDSCSVPEMIEDLAAFDELALLSVCSDDVRTRAAEELRTRVAGFLKSLPDRYPEICSPEYLASHREGRYAVVLLMEGNGTGARGYSSLRVENDTPDLLGGRPVKTKRPDGANLGWSIAMIVKRGLSLDQAKDYEAQRREAVMSGEPEALDELRLASNATLLEKECSFLPPASP